MEDFDLLVRKLVLAKYSHSLFSLGRENFGSALRYHLHVGIDGVDEVMAHIGEQATKCRGYAGLRRDQHASIRSLQANSTMCAGPAPPNPTSANLLGSWPRSTETRRIAPAILTFATRRMPKAASMRLSPSGSEIVFGWLSRPPQR